MYVNILPNKYMYKISTINFNSSQGMQNYFIDKIKKVVNVEYIKDCLNPDIVIFNCRRLTDNPNKISTFIDI